MTQSPHNMSLRSILMENCPHYISIAVRNLNETAETRSSVSLSFRVESVAIEYMNVLDGPQIVTSSYQSFPPRFISYGSFAINSTTTLSQIFHLFHEQEQFDAGLSVDLASEIFYEAIATDLDRNAINIGVLVTITRSSVSSVNILPSLVGETLDHEVDKLVRDDVIGEKLGLEMESCSICLENLLQVSEKVPTRMSCSHVFHDCCISQWLRRKNSCPLCRQVLLKR